MSTKNVVIDLLNSLIDGVNDVTGKQDTNLTDGVNSLIEGFGQGDGGGLENGYDVTFYDENNEELAFYSIKEGSYINAPVYQVKAWQTEDGTSIQFPYMPAGDIVLYANTSTYANVLYDYYDMNIAEYPYVLIASANGYVNIIFAKELQADNPRYLIGMGVSKKMTIPSNKASDLAYVVQYIMDNLSQSEVVSNVATNIGDLSGVYVYTNYEIPYSFTQAYIYRLDQ